MLMQLQPYTSQSSNRVMIFARWVICLSYVHGLSSFVKETKSSDCADETLVSFSDFASVLLFLVPLVILYQILYEFIVVPIQALREERRDVALCSFAFWRLLIFEGGYGYHVKDATPMDRFARFEAFMASAGVDAMQESNTAKVSPIQDRNVETAVRVLEYSSGIPLAKVSARGESIFRGQCALAVASKVPHSMRNALPKAKSRAFGGSLWFQPNEIQTR